MPLKFACVRIALIPCLPPPLLRLQDCLALHKFYPGIVVVLLVVVIVP